MNKINPAIIRIISLVIVFFIFIIIFSNSIFLTIQPGHAGVLFRRFAGGLDTENIYKQGFHVIAPWNKMFVYDVRIQENLSEMEVLSKNGLSIRIDVSYRYAPELATIGLLHNEIGSDYHDRIIIPELRSATREVIGRYLPEELYSTKREVIQTEIFTRTREKTSQKNINLDAVLIREVSLPASLQTAIEKKLKQEQEFLEYEFKIQRAEQEAERQRIEAEGKAKANIILSQSLTDKILREKGIEATLMLSESPNAKVVIVGNPQDGLPLILGNN